MKYKKKLWCYTKFTNNKTFVKLLLHIKLVDVRLIELKLTLLNALLVRKVLHSCLFQADNRSTRQNHGQYRQYECKRKQAVQEVLINMEKLTKNVFRRYWFHRENLYRRELEILFLNPTIQGRDNAAYYLILNNLKSVVSIFFF